MGTNGSVSTLTKQAGAPLSHAVQTSYREQVGSQSVAIDTTAGSNPVATAESADRKTPRSRGPVYAMIVAGVLVVLSLLSLMLGAADADSSVVAVSRIPRTLAALLAGSALAMGGLIMQLLARNRFVEASTVGSTESAMAGLLAVALLLPGAPMWAKLGMASLTALIGTIGFLVIVSRIKVRTGFTVPLVGIIYGGIIGAATTFFAYSFDLLQSLGAWQLGSFAGVLRGRYEILWLVAVLALAAYVLADRLTLLGLGHDLAKGVGVRVKLVEYSAIVIVAVIAAVTVTVVGAIPFIGLIVPNLVRARIGDNARKALPWVAACGAAMTLGGDIVSRIIRYPYEIPVGTVLGVLGAAVFLYILIRGARIQNSTKPKLFRRARRG